MKILNADPKFGRPLTEDQIKDFLDNSRLNIHIATIDEKGQPNIHPTRYYFDATKNKIYVETAKSSKKVENLNRNNLIYYCVDVPYMPYKGVRGKGKARIYEDIKHNIPIAEKNNGQIFGKSSTSYCNIYYGYCQGWRFSYSRNYSKFLFNLG